MAMDNGISTAWQGQCMVADEIAFLNAGTLAPTLRGAFEAMQTAAVRWMRMGPGSSLELRSARAYLNMMEEQDKCRGVVASWLGVDRSSVALLGNATDGINAALHSITWHPGDRILTTDEEHDALSRPLEQLQRHHGVIVDVISYPQNAESIPDFMAQLGAHLTSETRLVALSEVSHRSGVRLSIEAVIDVLAAHPEIWCLIDGAHAAGTTVNPVKSGVDFYVFPGHKWLFGPVGTGVLWVSKRVLAETEALESGAPMISQQGVRLEDRNGAWRYEYGTRDWTKLIGLAWAVEFRRHWDEATWVAHYVSLGSVFADSFAAVTGRNLLGQAPLFSIQTADSDRIANDLWTQHKVVVKPQAGNIRISIPPWLNQERSAELGELLGLAMQD